MPLATDVFLRIAAVVLPLGAVIIGWVVVAKQTDARERRRDIREQIAAIKQRCSIIFGLVGEYYGTSKTIDYPLVAIKLKAEIRSLGSALKALQSAGFAFDYGNLLADLRMAITGGDFDSAKRSKVHDPIRILESCAAIDDLIDALETLYFETHVIAVRSVESRKP